MVSWLEREQEEALAKARHYYDLLSNDAKEAFHDGLDTITIHPVITMGVIFALGFCIGVIS